LHTMWCDVLLWRRMLKLHLGFQHFLWSLLENWGCWHGEMTHSGWYFLHSCLDCFTFKIEGQISSSIGLMLRFRCFLL
jgi:hypothetical protein